MKLTPNMLRGLAAAVEYPGGATTHPSTVSALINRGLILDGGRVYGRTAMYPTRVGRALIEALGGPREARIRSEAGALEYDIKQDVGS